jgi:hypothetical protein
MKPIVKRNQGVVFQMEKKLLNVSKAIGAVKRIKILILGIFGEENP